MIIPCLTDILGIERIEINTCPCRTAAVQLVGLGLFPCAPLYPMLAVDIRILNFVTHLFLRIALNNTAWLDALEEFLNSQGYQLQGTVSFVWLACNIKLKAFI